VGKPQTFRSQVAVVVWVVWLLFAIANWIDLAVQGRDHTSAVAAAALLLATGVAYVTAQRPRVIADDAGVTIRNPLRDHRIGWAGVAQVDVVDLLRVHCDGGVPGDKKEQKVISAWAVHYSRRHQLTAEAKARRATRIRRSPLAFPSGGRGLSYGAPAPVPEAPTAEAEAEKAVRLLSDRAQAARAAPAPASAAPASASAAPAPSPPQTQPLTSTWSGRAVAALVIPALILLLVWLL